MATTLPVLQAFDATTHNFVSSSWVSLFALGPSTSFTVGHRYLFVVGAEVRAWYDGSYHDCGIELRYNGGTSKSSTSVIRSEGTKWEAISFMEVLQIPSGVGSGMQFGGYWINGTGAQVRNIRLVAVDLDVDNTDLPQQSVNGWLYAANETTQNLTGSYAPYLTLPTVTPDGGSDYLIIGHGNIYNVFNGWGYLGIAVDGVNLATSQKYCGTYGSPGTMVVAGVARLPAIPTSISLVAAGTSATPRIINTHLFAIRLQTFTKQAGTYKNPTVVSGTSWQSAVSVSPTPAPAIGESFLVFSQVKGYLWTSHDASLSARVLRNPGSTEILNGITADHQNSGDFIGSTLCMLDTTDGANTYEQQFKREDYVDRPQYVYNSCLVAVKAEVEYTPPVNTFLPVHQVSSAGPITLTGTETAYLSIPDTKFTVGHRYLVLGYCESRPNGGTAVAQIKFQGTVLNSTQNTTIKAETTEFIARNMMARFTASHASGALELVANWSGSSGAIIRNMRIVAIDLDINNQALPQDDPKGWKWSENNTPASLFTTPIHHTGFTFTPDGASTYLILGGGVVGPPSNAGIRRNVGLWATGGATVNFFESLSSDTTDNESFFNATIVQPTASPTFFSVQAYLNGSSTCQILSSRLIVIRLNSFVKWDASWAVHPPYTTGTNWQQVTTVSPAPVEHDQFLILSQLKAIQWVDNSSTFSTQTLRNPNAIALNSQTSSNIYNSLDIIGPTVASFETADGANTYELQVKRDTLSDRPQNFYYGLLAAIGTELVSPVSSLSIVSGESEGTWTLTGSWVTMVTLAGSNFIAGHRYLVFGSCLLGNTAPGTAMSRTLFNGSEIFGSWCFASRWSNTEWGQQSWMAMITGTGSGTGLQMQGKQNNLGACSAKSLRLRAIDLDSDNYHFPPQSSKGWVWAENVTPLTLTTSLQTHASVTFTPDGESDYLVIGHTLLGGSNAAYDYNTVYLDSAEYPDPNPSRSIMFCDRNVDEAKQFSTAKWVTGVTGGVPLTFRLRASRNTFNGGFETALCSRLLVLRLKTFSKSGAGHQWAPTVTGVTEAIVASATPSPAVAPTDQFLIFHRVESGVPWGSGANGNNFDVRLYKNIGGQWRASYRHSFMYPINDYTSQLLVEPVTATTETAYEYRVKRNGPESDYPYFHDALVVALKTELIYEPIHDVVADSNIITDGDMSPELLTNAQALSDIEVAAGIIPELNINAQALSDIEITATATPSVDSGASITIISPQNNDVGVPNNAEIVFKISSDAPVVDITNLNVYQDSTPVMLAGVFMSEWSGEIIENIALQDYTVIIILPVATTYGSGARIHFLIEYEEL